LSPFSDHGQTYNEKQLSYKEEKRDTIRAGIDNITPTIKLSNGNSWDNGTISRNNQLLISGETKLFAATGKWLTSYIGDSERKRLLRVSVLEEIESQFAKLLDGSASEKTTAYLFLKRITRKDDDLYSKIEECYGVTKSFEIVYERLLKDREKDENTLTRLMYDSSARFSAAPLLHTPKKLKDDICTPSSVQNERYNELYFSLIVKESFAGKIENKFAKIPFKNCKLMRLAYLQTLI
jgi:hypothetical protein